MHSPDSCGMTISARLIAAVTEILSKYLPLQGITLNTMLEEVKKILTFIPY